MCFATALKIISQIKIAKMQMLPVGVREGRPWSCTMQSLHLWKLECASLEGYTKPLPHHRGTTTHVLPYFHLAPPGFLTRNTLAGYTQYTFYPCPLQTIFQSGIWPFTGMLAKLTKTPLPREQLQLSTRLHVLSCPIQNMFATLFRFIITMVKKSAPDHYEIKTELYWVMFIS